MEAARVRSWIEHQVKARTRHSVHSPFVYRLIEEVLRPRPAPPELDGIEALRRELLRSPERIPVSDLGAGSQALRGPVRRVADVARTALKPRRQALMLYRLCRFLGARTVLELGTSLGLTTLYLAHGAEGGTVTTFEGCPETLRIARRHFERLGRGNIRAVQGSFQERLPEELERMGPLDLAFIDGHHAEEPTMDLFARCLAHAHEGSAIAIDDIHWSRGMEAAWARIRAHPQATVSIDLYGLGLVFPRRGQAKEHFRLRY